MADVQVAVGFGWKARMHAAPVFTGCYVFFNKLLDEIQGGASVAVSGGITDPAVQVFRFIRYFGHDTRTAYRSPKLRRLGGFGKPRLQMPDPIALLFRSMVRQ